MLADCEIDMAAQARLVRALVGCVNDAADSADPFDYTAIRRSVRRRTGGEPGAAALAGQPVAGEAAADAADDAAHRDDGRQQRCIHLRPHLEHALQMMIRLQSVCLQNLLLVSRAPRAGVPARTVMRPTAGTSQVSTDAGMPSGQATELRGARCTW